MRKAHQQNQSLKSKIMVVLAIILVMALDYFKLELMESQKSIDILKKSLEEGGVGKGSGNVADQARIQKLENDLKAETNQGQK